MVTSLGLSHSSKFSGSTFQPEIVQFNIKLKTYSNHIQVNFLGQLLFHQPEIVQFNIKLKTYSNHIQVNFLGQLLFHQPEIVQFKVKLKTYFNLDIFTCVCALSRSVVTDSVVPWTAAYQVPLPMEFSRQEYWSGVPFPTPGDLS